jgi:hypothetical protein
MLASAFVEESLNSEHEFQVSSACVMSVFTPLVGTRTSPAAFALVGLDNATETAPVKGRSHRVSVVYLCNNTSGRKQGG